MQLSLVQYVFTSPIHPKENAGDANIGQIESHMDKMEESLNQLLDLKKRTTNPETVLKVQNQLKELNNSQKN